MGTHTGTHAYTHTHTSSIKDTWLGAAAPPTRISEPPAGALLSVSCLVPLASEGRVFGPPDDSCPGVSGRTTGALSGAWLGRCALLLLPGASLLWQQVAGDWGSDTQRHPSAGSDPRSPFPYLSCPSGGPGLQAGMLMRWSPSKSQLTWAKDIYLYPGLSEVAVKPSPAWFDSPYLGGRTREGAFKSPSTNPRPPLRLHHI